MMDIRGPAAVDVALRNTPRLTSQQIDEFLSKVGMLAGNL